MTAALSPAPEAPQAGLPTRIHRALMPDYNLKASLYWYGIVATGVAVIAHALAQVAAMPAAAIGQTLSGIVIATVAGMFPVKIPRSTHSIAAGDVFIFLLLLLLGPAAATLAAASEAAVATARSSRRWSSRIASPAMAAVSMATCGALFHLLAGPASHPGASAGAMVLALMAMSVAYFALNAILTTAVVRLKRDEPLRPFALVADLGWVGVAYAGSASIAGLLFLTSRQFGTTVLVAAAPIIAMFLATMHHYFKRQEADEEIRQARVEAAERESEQAARHVGELQRSERRFHSAFTHASIGMALVSRGGRVLQVNEAMRALLDRDESLMIGHPFGEFVLPDDLPALATRIAKVESGESDAFQVELRCLHREGLEVWVALHGSIFSDDGATERCLILQAQDITARRRAEGRLQHIAFHDSLTNLPNRSRFHESLRRAIALSRDDPRQRFAVMFLDFDRFKLINDSMGHSVGDEFLVQVTRRIRDNVRPTDEVARLGGDEFAILCWGVEREEMAIELAERLQEALCRPLRLSGNEIATSASIGITFSSVGYSTPEEVLRDADIAMYQAKSAGRARHALFDSGLRAQVSERVLLESDLRRAIENGEISAVYQPMFDLATGSLTGFEALARWDHPARGSVSPEVFIPLAEEAGILSSISGLVLERACAQLADWQKANAACADLRMQVNVSGTELAHPAFHGRVKRAIAGASLKPEHVTLELTENVLMNGLKGAVGALASLRDLGVGISIDDFGTGYSSLSYLSTLPIDSLKIDRSFVRNLRENAKEAEIVRAIVSLGKALGKTVIAEGIESPSQLVQLRRVGVELGQGYYLSPPLAADRARQLIDRLSPPEMHYTPRAGLVAAAPSYH